MEDNVFSSLFKWGDSTSKEEDYYSKNLALILSHLLDSPDGDCRLVAVDILNGAFAKKLGFSFYSSDDICIQAHKKWEDAGIPDITIQAGNKLIYIEIKVSSPMDGEALKRVENYRSKLSTQKEAENCGLILITRSGYESVGSISLEQISWFALSGELREALKKLKRNDKTESVAIYLLDKFYEFLKEGGMAILKVENNFDPATIYNLTKLFRMLDFVCKDKELKFSKSPLFAVESSTQAEDSWLGYQNKKDGNYAIGIYAEDPVSCYFEIRENDEIKRLFVEKGDGESIIDICEKAVLWKEDNTIGVKLDLDINFWGKDERGQTETLQNFIKEIIGKWERLKKEHRERG